ncbi:hypothetical protein Pelo_17120 [Pelomyxa schiedti]|nr:hypothetical protein Pelo_17120 [Pelomyxa schiedti]
MLLSELPDVCLAVVAESLPAAALCSLRLSCRRVSASPSVLASFARRCRPELAWASPDSLARCAASLAAGLVPHARGFLCALLSASANRLLGSEPALPTHTAAFLRECAEWRKVQTAIVGTPRHAVIVAGDVECVCGVLRTGIGNSRNTRELVMKILTCGNPPVDVLRAVVPVAVQCHEAEVLNWVLGHEEAGPVLRGLDESVFKDIWHGMADSLWKAGLVHGTGWNIARVWDLLVSSPQLGLEFTKGLVDLEKYLPVELPKEIVNVKTMQAGMRLNLPNVVHRALIADPSLASVFTIRATFDQNVLEATVSGMCSGIPFTNLEITCCGTCAARYQVLDILRVLDRVHETAVPRETIVQYLLTPMHLAGLTDEDVSSIITGALLSQSKKCKSWIAAIEALVLSEKFRCFDYAQELNTFFERKSHFTCGPVILFFLKTFPSWRQSLNPRSLAHILVWVDDGAVDENEFLLPIASEILTPTTQLSVTEFTIHKPKKLALLLSNCKFTVVDLDEPALLTCSTPQQQDVDPLAPQSMEVYITPLTLSEANPELCALLEAAGATRTGGHLDDGTTFTSLNHLSTLLSMPTPLQFY